ncbi:MAG: T9SS type A sorting domain-containing protein [Saprospiraceae bacterium]|nr:T9SS type A sorting domain-containing protein [Candidatus Defluviibacterium haderslevense]
MGTNVGSGTEISIFGSNFFIKAISSDGINLAGAFPASSKIDIYGNYFATGSIITKTTRGISSDGNRNNLSIYGNEFTGNGYWNTTISCSNSVGINNYISDNHTEGTGYIETSGEYFSHGMFINNFQNATICHNTNLFGSDYAFNFWGTNLGTDFKNNIMIANPLAVEIFNKSQIDIQLHNGNKWLPYYSQSQNGFTLIWRTKAATCKDPSDAPFSKFIVHTDQSIWNDVDKKYDFFSEYFGELIEPNTDEFFKIDYNGIPVSNCSIKLASINENDKLIAEDSLISSTNAYIGWSSKLYLYKKLMENPILLDSCISCQSFIINNSTSSIGHLYEIYTTIESAFKADSLSYYQSGLTLLQIDSLVKNVEFIDNQMDSTLNYFIEDSLLNLKSILLEEIQILQNSYRTMNDLYYSEVLNLLNNALNLTQHFNPQSQLESNEKNVTLIYLQSLINQNGSLNSEQIDTLILISQQNSDIGGQAVANAYNLLPDCKKIGLNYYLNEIFLTPLNPIPDTLFNINPIINKNSFLKSTDYFSTLNELNSIDQNLGTLKIFDLSGRVLYEQNECLNIVPSNLQQQLPSGVYFICFQNIQGLRIKKYVIQN